MKKITFDPFQDFFGTFTVMITVIIIIFIIVFVIIIYFVIKMFTGGSKRGGEGISPDNPYSSKFYKKKKKEKIVTSDICSYCGEKIEENLKICPHCGHSLT